MTIPSFSAMDKIPRLNRECVVTEKIDGTNSSITFLEDGQVLFGSRNRWITPEDDNFGFARWAMQNIDDLRVLGFGTHFGEWWGSGIQRNYGLKEKRFSLFNVERWGKINLPSCVSVVPVLYRGDFKELSVADQLSRLSCDGSLAAPGFMKPEGIIIYHTAARQLFKVTLEKDEKPKGSQE